MVAQAMGTVAVVPHCSLASFCCSVSAANLIGTHPLQPGLSLFFSQSLTLIGVHPLQPGLSVLQSQQCSVLNQ